MCMLTAFPMPELLDDATIERLHNGASFNQDGHGWAVVQDGHIVTGKSFDITLAVDAFAVAYKDATGPALFHSRFATHGSTGLDNVHPFPVRKVRDTYVAHNGILPTDAHPEKWDARSDTRIFADQILPARYVSLDSAKTRDRLSTYLGVHNKIAVLTANRKFRRNLYIIGMNLGEWVDGVWFSNSDHEGYGRYLLGRGRLDTFRSDEAQECVWCHLSGVVDEEDFCESCGTCQMCYEPRRACTCGYRPDDVPAGKRWWEEVAIPQATILGKPAALETGVASD